MNYRLSVRIAIVVGVFTLVGAIIVSFVTYLNTLSNELSAAQHTLFQLGQTVERTASIAAYLDNKEIADDAVLGLAKNEIVAAVEITSVRGLRVTFNDPKQMKSQSAVYFKLTSPFGSTEEVGQLVIHPRQDLVERNARVAALERAAVLGGYTLVVALLVMFTIQLQFVPSLKKLANNMNKIELGTDQRLELSSQHNIDEIGALTRDINQVLSLVQEKLNNERSLLEEVRLLERRFRLIFERASVGIFVLDENNQLLMTNSAFKEIIGPLKNFINNESGDDLIRVFNDADMIREMIHETIVTGKVTSGDFQISLESNGKSRWVHCLFTVLREDINQKDSLNTYVQGIITDITDRKREEMLIRFQAEHDPLTHLFNRRSAEHQLESSLAKARLENSHVAILIIDLDDFKPVNDNYGHEAGDRVLSVIAKRIRQSLRENDLSARIGGDEFLVAIVDANRIAAEKVSQKIINALSADIELKDGNNVRVGVSIGVALTNDNGYNLNHLMSVADQAMYKMKKQDKGNYFVYDSSQS